MPQNGNAQQQQQQNPDDREYDAKRRHSDSSSNGSSGKKASAVRKRQRIQDNDGDNDGVIALDSPPSTTAPALPPEPATQQQKELMVTNPNQLPSSTPRASASDSDSDVELDDDVPLVLRPIANNTARRSRTNKQPSTAAATPTPPAPSASDKSLFSTSSSGKRRLSKPSVKTPTTTSNSNSNPAMSPSKPTRSSTSASHKSSSASSTPPSSSPSTPPGASPSSAASTRTVSGHMSDRLVEAIGTANAADFAAGVSNFILSHNSSLRETRDLYFRLLSNLKSNTTLLARVQRGEITAEQLCTMREEDMAGDEVRKEREEAKKASIRDVTMAKEMMIAKQTKAGVEYIAVAGDKLTMTDMFDEKLTLAGTEGREEGDEAEDGTERKMTDAEFGRAGEEKHSDLRVGMHTSRDVSSVDDEFLSFDEIEQRRQSDPKLVDYESKYASDADDDEVMEQPRVTLTAKRKSDALEIEDDETTEAAARKRSRHSQSPSHSSMNGAMSSGVDVSAEVSSVGVVTLTLSPKMSSHTPAAELASPSAEKRKQANRADAIELDLDQPSSSAVPHPPIVQPPAASAVLSSPTTPPALTPATPPRSPPSVIPLPSLQPVGTSAAAGLFLGPLQSSSRWQGQLYFNGHNTTIAFNGRLLGVAGQSQSNTAVKALSSLPAPPAVINIAGREPTTEASRLLNECLTSPRLMALLYVLQPVEAADATAMEEFCAVHADKQRVAIADMRKESGLFYRFGRMGAMGDPLGKELPLDVFARCFSGVKGLKDARSHYCVIVYAEKRASGSIPAAVTPRRQESTSSVLSIASNDSRASSSKPRSAQAEVVTPPPPAQSTSTSYPPFPAPPTAAQRSTFTFPPYASPAPSPSSLPPSAHVAPSPAAAAPPTSAAYSGYQQPHSAAGYYPLAQQYQGYMPAIPEQPMATAPSPYHQPYTPAQYNQSTYPVQPQHITQPHMPHSHHQPHHQHQSQPPPQPAAAPLAGASLVGATAAAPDNTDWNQVRKFLESIKGLSSTSPTATPPAPVTAAQHVAAVPPSPPRTNHYQPRPAAAAAGGRHYEERGAGRMEVDSRDAEMRRRYEMEVARLEEERIKVDAIRRETERLARESGRMYERERETQRDRSSSERDSRRHDYERERERDPRDAPKDQPRVYDSSRERERERERAEARHRPRGAGGGYNHESERDRIERELREAEQERERLAQLAASRLSTSYPPPSSHHSPAKTSGFIHPSRLAQAPR